MSRSPLLSCLSLPSLATACLGAVLSTGCLDDETVHLVPGSDDPLTLVAVEESPVTAIPPKPALAQLATATSAVRQRFVDAALGADVSAVFGTAVGFALYPSAACPKVERRGDTIYSTPDCTDDNGVHWSGRFVAHTWDDDRPMTIKLDRFSVDAPGTKDDVAYEGTVTVSPSGRFDSNLVAWKSGLVARTVGHWQVDDGKVVSDLDSYVLMENYGIAQIGGSWHLPRGERAEGLLILDGAQELDVDFDATATTDDPCAPVFVDGVPVDKRCDLEAIAESTASFGVF